MKYFFITVCITLISVASTIAQEEFKFEVTTTAENQVFAIPLSGGWNGSIGKAYNWNINWGDGSTNTGVSGTGSQSSAGILHTYTTAKTYQITITPAGSNDAWLAAFGFYNTFSDANAQANKDLLTKVISPITPLMTRTQAEITANTTTPPDYEWAYTFYGCRNLTMGPTFTFSNAWNSITTVGDNFARSMFAGCSGTEFKMNTGFNLPQNITTVGNYFAFRMFSECSGAEFNMNTGFNLPQNITSVGYYFAYYMFFGCSGAEFKMNTGFNLPQNITSVGNYFAYYMFSGCSGAEFKMNSVFNLPQNITSVGVCFAYYIFFDCSGAAFTMNNVFNIPQSITTVGGDFASGMFSGCSGNAFTMNTVFNLPQNITTVGNYFASGMFSRCSGAEFKVNNVFKFPLLTQSEIDKSNVFYRTFYDLGTATTQSRTAASIINGNPTPSSNRETFVSSGCFADRTYIPGEWGGDGLSITVIYNYNGASGENTTPSKTVTYNSAYGTLPIPTKDSYTVTYNYNGSAQANGSDTYNPAFSGWYSEATFENKVTETTIVTTFSDHTIYAKWTNDAPLTLPTPAANAGYTFVGWYSETEGINFVGNAGDSYIPTANATLFAKWVSSVFTIHAVSGPNGVINPSGKITVNAGSSHTFYFEPNTSYKINKVLIDGEENATAKENEFYTFTNINADHEIYVSFIAISGIDNVTAGKIAIYPNPAQNEIYIINNEQLIINNVEICDLAGKKKVQTTATTINVSALTRGIYLVKIHIDKGIVIQRLVKN